MTSKSLVKAAGAVCAIVLLAVSLSACGTAATQTQSSIPNQQTVSTPTQQTGTQSGSQSAEQPSQQPGTGQRPAGGQDMTRVLTRAAEILGVSSDKFTTAFNDARPQPPSGQQGEKPSQPPSGQQGQTPEPPSGQQGQPGKEFMTDIYTKMAEELGISADKIEAAMNQAMQELSNQ